MRVRAQHHLALPRIPNDVLAMGLASIKCLDMAKFALDPQPRPHVDNSRRTSGGKHGSSGGRDKKQPVFRIPVHKLVRAWQLKDHTVLGESIHLQLQSHIDRTRTRELLDDKANLEVEVVRARTATDLHFARLCMLPSDNDTSSIIQQFNFLYIVEDDIFTRLNLLITSRLNISRQSSTRHEEYEAWEACVSNRHHYWCAFDRADTRL